MAVLKSQTDQRRLVVPSRCLVGRAGTCSLRIEDRQISGEHAAIAWAGDHWSLRDLGSRNGTRLDGVRLVPGEAHRLAVGSLIEFARADHRWLVEDLGPPVATARDLDSGQLFEAEDGLLTLPDEADPRVVVFADEGGAWIAEVEGEPRPVTDGAMLQHGARAWQLHLPEPSAATMTAVDTGPTIDGLRLRFAVSADEEFVAVSLVHAGGAVELPPKAHHYTLLVMARLRLADAQSAPREQGWVYVEDLCQMLAVDDLRLNTDVYRIRKELARHGVPAAAGIIERRRPTRQLRLAVAADRLEVR